MGANRSRKYVRFSRVGVAVAEAFILPMNMSLVQVVVRFLAAPTTLGSNFRIWRDRAGSTEWDWSIVNEDLAITGTLVELEIGGKWEMQLGDTVRCDYANPDQVTVGIELVFEEAQ